MQWNQTDESMFELTAGPLTVEVSPSGKQFEVTMFVDGDNNSLVGEPLTKKFRTVEAAKAAAQKVLVKELREKSNLLKNLAKEVKELGSEDSGGTAN